MNRWLIFVYVTSAFLGASSGQVAAQCGDRVSVGGSCTTIHFEDYAVGTTLTGQYPGVVFSAVCVGAGTPVQPQIGNPSGTSWTQTRALTNPGICFEFPEAFLRMVFTEDQSLVTFFIGEGNYEIRAYNQAGTLLSTQNVSVPIAGSMDVLTGVRVVSGTGTIRRIEVEIPVNDVEWIDDLSFGIDTTPPEAAITNISFEQCVCTSVSVQGISCDSDGILYKDRLEYAPATAPDTWTLIDEVFGAPVCTPGALYTWNVSAPAILHGYYFLRLTSTNICGCEDTAFAVVHVDKQFDTLVVNRPSNNQIIGGSAFCITGTVDDHCFGTYAVEYRPVAAGIWSPMLPGPSDPNTRKINQTLATWNTTALVDGGYQVRVVGTDQCGNTASVSRFVTIDNTPPVAVITSPINCSFVDGMVVISGTASDAHIASWTLDYVGGASHDWVNIAAGVNNIVGGPLGNWNTAGLPRCVYALRLRVRDGAALDCYSGPNECDGSNVSEYYVTVGLGKCCDINHDGAGDGLDVQSFVTCLLSGICP